MLLTFDQVVAVLQADASTTLQLIADGDIPAPAIIGDRLVRWPTSAIAKWVDANCPASTPPTADEFARLRSLRLIEWPSTPEGIREITTKDKRERQQRRRTNRKPISAAGSVAGGKPGR